MTVLILTAVNCQTSNSNDNLTFLSPPFGNSGDGGVRHEQPLRQPVPAEPVGDAVQRAGPPAPVGRPAQQQGGPVAVDAPDGQQTHAPPGGGRGRFFM